MIAGLAGTVAMTVSAKLEQATLLAPEGEPCGQRR